MAITECKFISINFNKSRFFSLTATFFECGFQRWWTYLMRMSAITSANNIQDYLLHHNPKLPKNKHTRQNINR